MGIEDRKQREFNRRENDILEAAFDLFADNGIENVTIEMIAKAAEIGKGTIYKHFKSKAEIYASLIIGRGKEIYAQASEIDQSLPVLEKLRSVFALYVDLFFKKKKALMVFNKCETLLTPDVLSERVFKQVDTLNNMKTAQIEALFKQGVDEGIFINVKPSVLTMIAFGIFTGTMQQLFENQEEEPLDVIATMEKVLLSGILK